MARRILCLIKPALIMVLLLTPIFLALQTNIVAAQDTSFSVNIQPRSTTVNAGDHVTYSMRIEAEPGFNSPIKLDLKITAVGFNVNIDLDTQNPPYPKEFEHTIDIPGDIPVDVTAKGTLIATSGSVVQQEEVEILIKAGTVTGESWLDWLIQMFRDLWDRITGIGSSQ